MKALNRELLKTALLILVLLAIMLLTGCASEQVMPDPDYAPVYPRSQQPRPINGGAIYSESNSMDLFGTTKAGRVGDILTVVLEEKTDAKKESSNEGNRSADATLTDPTVFGRAVTLDGVPILNTSVGSEQEFEAEAETEQSNELSGNIAVMVVDELPGGNLVVRGEKIVTLNRGDEYIRISGIVRKLDINPDNTISSTKMANARIAYSGRGSSHNYNDMGWMSRFFSSTVSPF